MEKLLFLSLVILMPCVMIVTEAGFFGDYGILEQNIQSIGFGGDSMYTLNHDRLQQTSNFDLYGNNNTVLLVACCTLTRKIYGISQ